MTIVTRALLRLERTLNLLCHLREGGREGGKGGEGRGGERRGGEGGEGGREGERREGERREGREGREGRDDCYTYYSDGTIYYSKFAKDHTIFVG